MEWLLVLGLGLVLGSYRLDSLGSGVILVGLIGSLSEKGIICTNIEILSNCFISSKLHFSFFYINIKV